MSTATVVPETFQMRDDDPGDVMRRITLWGLLRRGVSRLRAADGTSLSRATALQTVLALVPGFIVLVAVAALLGWESLNRTILDALDDLAPGQAGDVFRQAFEQGQQASRRNSTAVLLGSLALVVSGTTVFAQIERTANRIYGIERDRPFVRRYARAFLLLLSAGLLLIAFLLTIGIGGSWDIESGFWGSVWAVAHWVLGAAFLTGAFFVTFKYAPRRHQPGMPWLLTGALVGVVLALAATGLLRLYLLGSGNFGATYGPLAGYIGVLIWSFAVALCLSYGLAIAAQLEAVRAGVLEPRSEDKAEAGEVDSVTVSYGAAVEHAAPNEHDELDEHATTGSRRVETPLRADRPR